MKSSGIKTSTVLASFLLAACLSVHAEVKLPAIFSDGMVMQQQTNANLWRTATPNKKVTVITGWNGKQYTIATDENDSQKFSVSIPEAGGPYTITFDDGIQKALNNILIDELWLCSGQSNMEMPMKGSKNQPVEDTNMDIPRSKSLHIRLLMVKRTSTTTPQNDVVGSQKEAAPVNVRDLSVTAYYLGGLVNEILEVPVGLVVAAWSGSVYEARMIASWLKTFPDAKILQPEADIKLRDHIPAALYNGMLYPLIGMIMREVIWYQGEDNWSCAYTYANMFTTLINGWRIEWRQGDSPLYYCQVAPYDYGIITGKGKKVINSAYLREAQAKVEHRVSGSDMIALLDAGMEKEIHPVKKQVAGECLALLVLTKTYGIERVSGESPYYKSIGIKNDTIIVNFECANMWIGGKNCFESKDFQVTGRDRVFYPTKAWVGRSKMLVRSDKIPHPVAVRYGFENYVEGDVYCDGLSLGSFYSDDW